MDKIEGVGYPPKLLLRVVYLLRQSLNSEKMNQQNHDHILIKTAWVSKPLPRL